MRLLFGTDLRGYFGFLGGRKVLGLWKCTDVRIFLTLVPWIPFKTFFWLFKAFCNGAAALTFDAIFLDSTTFLTFGLAVTGLAAGFATGFVTDVALTFFAAAFCAPFAGAAFLAAGLAAGFVTFADEVAAAVG